MSVPLAFRYLEDRLQSVYKVLEFISEEILAVLESRRRSIRSLSEPKRNVFALIFNFEQCIIFLSRCLRSSMRQGFSGLMHMFLHAL